MGKDIIFPGSPIFGFCLVKYFPGHRTERKWTLSASSRADFSCSQRFKSSGCALPQLASLFSPRVPSGMGAKMFSGLVSQKEEVVLQSKL